MLYENVWCMVVDVASSKSPVLISQEGISTTGAPDLVPRGLSKAGLRRKAEVRQAGLQMGGVKNA